MSLVNWDELKHIHVVRKLQSILGQWFNTEVFFVDERGHARNWDPFERGREFKSPLVGLLLGKERGREYFTKTLVDANEHAFKAEKGLSLVPGPYGIGTAVVARVAVGGEFLGCVYAAWYADRPVTEQIKAEAARRLAEELAVDPAVAAESVAQLKSLNDGERKYFHELIDLVAQEVVTFHMEITKRDERIHALNNQLEVRYSYDSMIGKAKPMQDLYGMLDKIKNSESTVLVQGENGTGKELIARAIHFNSARKDAQFVTVNCSAFTESLLDSELFGHVRGAFTGAIKDKKGLFESADKGTLFLDEIGDMQPAMQVKLLRVLQEGTLTPVGSTEMRKVDVRVVAATNKDLKAMVEAGTFREDLYYRINVINLVVPPLRARKEDIPMLIDHFLARGCKEKSLPLKTLGKRTMEKIYDYPWPGNIRELENEMERLIVLSGDEERVGPELLSTKVREWGEGQKVQGVRVAGKLKDALEELEKTMIREGLKRTGWNKSRLAKELGISRAGLIMKVEKYGLDKRKLARAGDDRGAA
jgi:transcriptional regulator with PAS, ATPase and Fis domain